MYLSRQGQTLVVHTPAKLNLSLRVLGKRDDGFHELETVMVSVRLYDTLRFAPVGSDNLSLRLRSTERSLDTQEIPCDGSNLVIRAAELLRSFTGCRTGAQISLLKRIPKEAGMGGGSSDAAATLVGLNQLWKLGLRSADLHSLAAQLGSDVNFFLDSHHAAICRGRGEIVEPIETRQPIHFVVSKPRSGLSTAAVFRQWNELKNERHSCEHRRPDTCGGNEIPVHNDLENVSRELNHDVNQILSRFRDFGATQYAMTGSGTACFAVCRTARHARSFASRCTEDLFGRVFTLSSGV